MIFGKTLKVLRRAINGNGENFLSWHFAKVRSLLSRVSVEDWIWSRKPAPRRRVPSQSLELAFGANLPAFSSILEIGPGTGAFTKAALLKLSNVNDYVLVESDPNWARHCEKLISRLSPKTNIDLVITHNASFFWAGGKKI